MFQASFGFELIKDFQRVQNVYAALCILPLDGLE